MISHPDKVLFPEDGITKGELADYYDAIAPVMLPHLRGRPVTMERFPSGIGHQGFLQKDVSKGFPDWLKRVEVPKKGGSVHHPLIDDHRSLMWLANQNCITPHVWTSRAPKVYQPDICVFDLDPSLEEPEHPLALCPDSVTPARLSLASPAHPRGESSRCDLLYSEPPPANGSISSSAKKVGPAEKMSSVAGCGPCP